MRPTKLTEKIISTFKKILDDPLNVAVCTDYELFFLLNDELEEAEQLSYRTFQRYKAFAIKAAKDRKPAEPIYKELYRLLMRAIIRQKRALYTKILEAKRHWHRFKWVFERKFGPAMTLDLAEIKPEELGEISEAHKRYYFDHITQMKEQGYMDF